MDFKYAAAAKDDAKISSWNNTIIKNYKLIITH